MLRGFASADHLASVVLLGLFGTDVVRGRDANEAITEAQPETRAPSLAEDRTGLLKSIHVLFECALLVRGFVLVDDALSGETVQVPFHVVQ